MRYRLLLPCLFAFTLSAAAQYVSTTYKDPQNRFSVAVPQGWTTAPASDAIQLMRGNASASIRITAAQANVESVIEAIASELGRGWLGFQRGQSAHIKWADQPASVVVYSGVNPAGVRIILKLNAATVGGQTYVLAMAAPQKEIAALNTGFIEIENSFAIAPNQTTSPGPVIS